MVVSRVKNEAEKDYALRRHIEAKEYAKDWVAKKTDNSFIQSCLSGASKRSTGHRGEPDLIYYNESLRLLILLENKDSIKDHISTTTSSPTKYAVDGVKHYLSFFKKDRLAKVEAATKSYFEGWRFVGIAVSGDINDKYSHRVSTYRVNDNTIVNCDISEILSEAEYVSLFENIDEEALAQRVSVSSSIINKNLRNIDSQKRPILLSALMICLYDSDNTNDFISTYQSRNADSIASDIPLYVKKNLKKEGIPEEKINVLIDELAFLNNDIKLRQSDTLKDILIELQHNVIPLFKVKSNYDIIGKFYEEFLRFAGVTNVKKGIVLTPHHIAELFTELVPLKYNDCIIDCCCGTGAFLISGMNKILGLINSSAIEDKSDKIKRVKSNQLIGFEESATMFTLAISNMLFRGDGKSQIYHEDFFSKNADDILSSLQSRGINPTIGFINPPYGGEDNKSNPTKKEIQFIERLLDCVSRYVVVIAPLSTYFSDDDNRNRILKSHTLKCVVNMPKELFMPNAATNTAIAVFEAHTPHHDKEVVMYDLKDDGFVLSKSKGRTDVFNRWGGIKESLLGALSGRVDAVDGINCVKAEVKADDEWIIQAHSAVDYSGLSSKSFTDIIKRDIVSILKSRMGVPDDIYDIDLFELIGKHIKPAAFDKGEELELDTANWREFKLGSSLKKDSSLFFIEKGERLVKAERVEGDYPLITASSYRNGKTSSIDRDDALERGKMLCSNKITVDMFCNVFYHQYDYFSDDNVHTLFFRDEKYNFVYDNIYVNIFLMAILSLFKNKFAYGRQVRIKRLKQLSIYLPVTATGEPDWAFMESYVKRLQYSSNL